MVVKKTIKPEVKVVPEKVEENKPKWSDEKLKELEEASGETTVKQTKYVVPILKFNGNKGIFSLLTQKKDGTLDAKEIGETIEGTILKIRRVFTSFEKVQGGDISFFTNEHNSFRDTITLFERKKGVARAKIVDGNQKIDKIRENYPALRLKQQLYFLYKGEIVKLGVKGKSLSQLFEFYKEFSANEHMYQFSTRITNHSEENEGGLKYFVMDFTRGNESDPEIVAPAIKGVADALALQDKSFQDMPAEDFQRDDPQFQKPAEDIPIIEEDSSTIAESTDKPEPKEDEIKVEDIPF